MGNCFKHCCFKNDKRHYLRTRYNVASEVSVEIESLVDNASTPAESSHYGSAMTEYERQLLSERKFHDLVQYQIKIDAEIEAQLLKQEDQLRQEEEAFYEARRLAVQLAAENGKKTKDDRSRTVDNNYKITNADSAMGLSSSSGESGRLLADESTKHERPCTLSPSSTSASPTSHQWAPSADWDMATVEDDFEQFLSDIQLTPNSQSADKSTLSPTKGEATEANLSFSSDSNPQCRPDLLLATETSQRHQQSNRSIDDDLHEGSDNDWNTDFVTAADVAI